jgi:hypothetical protein
LIFFPFQVDPAKLITELTKKAIWTYSFGLKTAPAPLGNAYEPSGVAINMDFGMPVGGFILLTSYLVSPFVGQCWMKWPANHYWSSETGHNIALTKTWQVNIPGTLHLWQI